jgi:hypothetical protein
MITKGTDVHLFVPILMGELRRIVSRKLGFDFPLVSTVVEFPGNGKCVV